MEVKTVMNSNVLVCGLREQTRRLRVLAAVIVTWLLSVPVTAQPQLPLHEVAARQVSTAADTLQLRFRLRESELDMSYGDNSLRVDAFMARLHEVDVRRHGDFRVKVYTGASPEGPAELNRRLGERRGQALRRLLQERMAAEGMDFLCPRIIVINEGARWAQLYRQVERSQEPWRDRVLEVLRQEVPAGQEWLLDPREEQLRQLEGGAVWQRLQQAYLPPLRSVGTAVLAREAPTLPCGQRDTLVIRDTVYYMPYAMAGGVAVQGAATSQVASARQRNPLQHGKAWTLKSNLLLLALATPNLQAEWSLGNRGRWSLCLEAAYMWVTLSHNAYANQLLYGSLELRHWLGNRRRHSTLSGWHIGLAVGGGLYDLEWKSRGYQGEAISGFLNLGWQHRYGQRRQWCFDLGVGIGLLTTKYRYYKGSTLHPEGHEEYHDDHLMWQRNGRLNWPGPVHVNLSIGYVFNKKK